MGRLRTILIVLVLVVLIAAAAILLLPQLLAPPPAPTPAPGQTPQPVQVVQPAATPVPVEQVVIALQPIPRGARITRALIDVVDWPVVAPAGGEGAGINAPPGSLARIEDVEGRFARTEIVQGQPILISMIVEDLTDPNALVDVGSDAAVLLEAGQVGITVPMDRLTSVGYAIQPGDRVDVIMSILFVDVDEEFQSLLPNRVTLVSQDPETQQIQLTTAIEGRLDPLGFGNAVVGPSERQRPRLVTQRTIQNAFVIHVGEFPPDGVLFATPTSAAPPPQQQTTGDGQGTPVPQPTPSRPNIVTLGVSPQDAVVLTWAIEARLPLTFVLRSVRTSTEVATSPVTLDYILTQFNIELPGRRPYSIEPAIRSIRQLVVEDQVSLSEGE